MAIYNFGFVMEQVLGHITHTKNLQHNIPFDPEVRTHWALVPWEQPGSRWPIPSLKANWTVQAGLRARAALSELARNTRIDALLFHTQVPAVLSADWLRRIPSIVSLDATPIQYDELGRYYQHRQSSSWLEGLKWQLNRNCYAAASHLVTWSQWAKDGLVEGYGVSADKITVVPPGVNIAEWRRPEQRGRADAPVKILFVGVDFERKGGPLLLQAFRALRPLGVELHLVTGGPAVAEPGVFVYNQLRANSPELRALYHQCDIFALPTYADCLPMVLSEAGAAGLPVVSTTVAAIPELVRQHETGLLVPAGDARSLEDALRRLVRQPELRLQLGERASAHISRTFDAKRNAGRLLDLLKGEVDMARMHMRAIA